MQIELPEFDRTRPLVLCLYSLQFNRDIAALQLRTSKYSWAALQDTFLADTQGPWLPPQLQVQTTYVNESGADVDAAWQKAKRFGMGILANLVQQGVNITAVLGGNFDYWQEECLRLACDEVGLPFLVLMREHDLTDVRFKTQEDYYRQVKRIPDVAAMACAGEATAEVYAGLNLFPRSKLRITGWPRHDVWRDAVTPAYDRPVILMSYHKGYEATQDFEAMMERFAQLSRRYPHIPFLVKAKHGVEQATLRGISDRHGLGLNIIDSMNLPSLLCNARVVIGFHSAAMYEALLAPAPIVIPRWGQTDQDPRLLAPSPTDPRLAGHMEFISTPNLFEETVVRYIESPPRQFDMAARAKVFGEYFAYDPDRTQSQRLEDFIDEFGRKFP